jgi:7-keto-8-aminopelargonate synthetase-like enzyme
MELQKDTGFIGENFDLKNIPLPGSSEFHLLNLKDLFGDTITENIQTFEGIFRPLYEKGHLLYHRHVCSPMDTEVEVFDQVHGSLKKMLMFGSNNYLGLANDPFVKQKVVESIATYGVGMAGPMLLNGTGTLQKQLEKRIARLKGKEDAIVLPTGYQANLAWVTSLLTDKGVLLYDEASHASLIDAIRMGRKKAFRFSAQDMDSLEALLMKYRKDSETRDIFVSLQGIYSMSGEVADLKTAAELCKKYRAFLVVDDAHGTGVLGQGRGTAEEFGVGSEVFLSMGTFSKAFAVTGGFLAGDQKTINFIRFFARSYFFTAAISPMVAAAVIAGIDIIESDPARVQKTLDNAEYFRRGLADAGIGFTNTKSAVVPVFPPAKSPFREVALAIHEENLFINPIEAPAVPLGAERFRISLMASHTRSQMDQAIGILKNVFERFQ